MNFATKQIHEAHPHIPGINPLATPIFQTATFTFETTEQGAARFSGDEQGYIYTRGGNPSENEIGAKIAALEGGEAGLFVSSGMGAISSTFWTLLKAGDHVLADRTLYGCTYLLISQGLTKMGVEVTFTDFLDLEAVKNGLQPNTKAVYFESVTNPDLKLIDIEALSGLVHGYDPAIQIIVDNTFATPYLLRPLALGADIVVHSATKYINGHGDVIAGCIIASKDTIELINGNGVRYMTGSVLGSFEAFLINRGLKTLDIRMEKHSANAMKIARFLEGHPAVLRVFYPGLDSHPQRNLAQKMFREIYGGMVTFELKCDRNRSAQFLNGLKLCSIAVSLGDAETLIEHPASMTHKAYEPEDLEKAGIRESMIRLSVGLEDPNDIIADLKAELDKIEL